MFRSRGLLCLAAFAFSGMTSAQSPDVDRKGDPLPTMAVARFGTTRWRLPLAIGNANSSLSISPDGKSFLVVSEGKLVFWDIATAKQIERFHPEPEVMLAAFAEDGKTIVVDRMLKRDIPSRLPGRRHVIETWDFTTGTRLNAVEGIQTLDPLFENRICNRVKTLLSFEKWDRIRLWDLATGKKTAEIVVKPGDYFMGGDLSPDGKLLAAAFYRQDSALYDTATGTLIRKLVGDRSRLRNPRFTPDGKSIVTIGPHSMWVWNSSTGQLRTEIPRCHGTIAFSADRKIMACADEDAIRLFDATTFAELRRFGENGAGPALAAKFSPDGKLLVVANGSSISLWDVATGKRLHDVPGHFGHITSLAFSHDGKLLASGGDGDGAAIIWDVATQKPVHRLTGHYLTVAALAFSRDDSKLATGDGRATYENNSYEAQIRLWDVASGHLDKQFTGHLNGIHCLSFSPDGRRLVTGGGDGKTRLFDIATGKRLAQLFGENGRKYAKFAPNGKSILVAGERGELATWKPDLSGLILDQGSKQQTVSFADLLRDGVVVDLSSPGRGAQKLSVWEPLTGNVVKTNLLSGQSRQGYLTCCITRDGKLLAAVPHDYRRHVVEVWDLESNQLLTELTGHAGHVNAVSFSPDGRFLATGSDDTTVLLWDVSFIRLENAWNDLLAEPEQVIRKYKSDSSRLVTILRGRVATAAAAEANAATIISALDDSDFSKRRQAQLELRQLGPGAEFAIRNRLEQSPTAQSRRTLNAILRLIEREQSHSNHFDPKRLHAALTLLEKLNTAESRAALKALASGPADSSLTKDAKAALERLQKSGKP